jgi:hypothetical protein
MHHDFENIAPKIIKLVFANEFQQFQIDDLYLGITQVCKNIN